MYFEAFSISSTTKSNSSFIISGVKIYKFKSLNSSKSFKDILSLLFKDKSTPIFLTFNSPKAFNCSLVQQVYNMESSLFSFKLISFFKVSFISLFLLYFEVTSFKILSKSSLLKLLREAIFINPSSKAENSIFSSLYGYSPDFLMH